MLVYNTADIQMYVWHICRYQLTHSVKVGERIITSGGIC